LNSKRQRPSKALHYLYRNLNNGKFSLRFKGLVIEHPEALIMHDVVFRVSKKGQARVREKRVKNVHALVGAKSVEIVQPGLVNTEGWREVFYCPYQCDSFVFKATQEPVYEANQLIGVNNRIFIK